jgi:hypothetical protein
MEWEEGEVSGKTWTGLGSLEELVFWIQVKPTHSQNGKTVTTHFS